MGHQPKYLGHVNIFVRNVERSHRWYTEVLGLHTYGLRPGQVAFLSADLEQSHEIALVQAGEDALAPQARHVGLNHMAWMMSSLDDLKELYQRLKDKGVPIRRVSDHGDFHRHLLRGSRRQWCGSVIRATARPVASARAALCGRPGGTGAFPRPLG